jgi:hypothetical protein
VCSSYAESVMLGRVDNADLAELSGMSASLRNPGVLFAHNDRARSDVFALARDGKLLARFRLETERVTDVEDIAIGPCPTGTCIVLADIGDNQSQRDQIAILRAPEPDVSAASDPAATLSLQSERFAFEYADGPHNAEGLLIDPHTGALYVVTKALPGEPSAVYALPDGKPGSMQRASLVMQLDVPRAGDMPVTAAASHPCGAGFALRTGNALYEYRIDREQPFTDAFSVKPVALPSPAERQSEAVTYAPDGRALLTSGEGAGAAIFELPCL